MALSTGASQPCNPPWSRDELILALDLYAATKGNPPGKASRHIAALSDLLNDLGAELGRHRSGKSLAERLI